MSVLWLFSWWKNKYYFAWKYKTSTPYSIYYPSVGSNFISCIHKVFDDEHISDGTLLSTPNIHWVKTMFFGRYFSWWKMLAAITEHSQRWCKIDNKNEWSVGNIWRKIWFNAINFQLAFFLVDFSDYVSFFIALIATAHREKQKEKWWVKR